MSSTTVPAVRAALVARLGPVLQGLAEVTYGHPGEQNIPPRFVAVSGTDEGGVTRDQRTFPLKVNRSRMETYDLRLVCWVLARDGHGPAQQQQATEACWALVDAIDNSLRAEPTLDGLVTWALPTSFRDEDFLLQEGRAAQVLVNISVHVNTA